MKLLVHFVDMININSGKSNNNRVKRLDGGGRKEQVGITVKKKNNNRIKMLGKEKRRDKKSDDKIQKKL
jgi:hypothetical protein